MRQKGAYNRELNVRRTNGGSDFVDVFYPLLMRLEAIGRETDQLYTPLLEVGGSTCNLTELSCANGCEIGRVREEDGPGVSNPIMEFNGSLLNRTNMSLDIYEIEMTANFGGLCFKIRSDTTESEGGSHCVGGGGRIRLRRWSCQYELIER